MNVVDRSAAVRAAEPSAEESIPAVLERMRGRLYARALFLTQNREAANDLFQQLCERALRAKASFQQGSNPGAWLYRIMRNLFLDEYRSQRTLLPLQGHEVPASETAGADDPTPFDLLTYEDVIDSLSLLPPKDRTILQLAWFEGLSYRAMAARIGLASRTAGSRIFRAKARLRRLLEAAFRRKIERLQAGRPIRRTRDMPEPASSGG